jgi:hypothetical protein
MVQPYGLDAGVRRRPVMSAFALPVMMANVRSTAAIRRAEAFPQARERHRLTEACRLPSD